MSIEGRIDRHFEYSARTKRGARITARGSDGQARLMVLVEDHDGHAAAIEIERTEFDEWCALVRSTVPVSDRDSDPSLYASAHAPAVAP